MKRTKAFIFVCAVITILISFYEVIVHKNSILIYPGDSFEQMYQFYLGGWQRYKDLAVSQWDWSLGLGGSFFSYVYYFATSPFFYLSLLFDKDFLKYSFLYFTLLKMLLVFCGTFVWLGKLSKNEISRAVGAFAITFSGWVFFYLNYAWFLDAFVFYPLILNEIENYFETKKIARLSLGIGVLGIVNYYFLYMFVPFMCMYALFRFIIRNRSDLTVRYIFIEAFKFVGIVLLGIAVSAVILLPCANLILGNNRFSGTEYSHIWLGKKDIFKIVSSLFMPVTYRFNGNLLIDISNHNSLGWGGGCSIYTSLLTPISVMSLFWIKDKFMRNMYASAYLIIGGMMCLFPFYKLFQMTIDSRWFYMIIFINVMTVSYILDQIYEEKVSTQKMVMAAIMTSITFGGLIAISFYLNLYQNLTLVYQYVFVALIFILLYTIVLVSYKKHAYLLIVLIMAECIWCGFSYNKNNETLSIDVFSLPEFSSDAIDYIREYETNDEFYRVLHLNDVYLDDGSGLFTNNEPFAKKFAGASFYSTVYSTEGNGFLDRLKVNWVMKVNKDRFETINLLSVKYIYSYLNAETIPIGFEEIYSTNDFTVYENKYYIPLGFSYRQTINENFVVGLDVLNQDMIFMEYLVTSESENETVNLENPMDLFGIYETDVLHSIDLKDNREDLVFYIMNFGNDNLTVRLFSNDTCIYENIYHQFGYISVPVLNKMEVTRIEFQSNDTYSYGNDVYVYVKPYDSFEKWYESASSNSFYNVHVDSDYVSGYIDIVDEATHVYTSIPYNKGWKVYCDGEIIDAYCAQLGMIGIDLKEGKHFIEFKYHTPLLNYGAAISCAAIILIYLISFRCKKAVKK